MTKVNGNTAVYNAENQLASLSTSTGASETIAYDALGYRVQKAVSGSSPVTYVYDAFGLAAEYVNGSWVKDYIADGSGNLVATENAAGGPCTTCYYTSDHLGSVRAVTDSNANVVGRHDYLPFGEEIQANTAGRDSHFGSITDVTEKITGQIRDQESGVDYFNARYFTAPLGRFNSPDPGNAGASLLSSQSWNGYAYVLGNPLASVDPTGMTTACTGNAAMHDPFCQIGPWAQYPGMNAINQVDPFGIQGSVSDYQLTLSTAGSQQSATINYGDDFNSTENVDFDPLVKIFGSFSSSVAVFASGGSVTGTPSATCPAVPQHPASVTLSANVSYAQQLRLILPPFKEYLFYLDVRNHGRFDYKQQGKMIDDLGKIGPSPFQDFGNFNFGVVGAAAGFPTQELLRGAGYAQQAAGTSSPEWGHWYGPQPPYGDDPADQAMIRAGIAYYQSGCVR